VNNGFNKKIRMKKVYFANTPWSISEELVSNFIHQTPDNKGVWENIEYTLDKSKADYIVVMDYNTEPVDDEKVIFFGREPKHVKFAYKEWNQKSFGNYHHEKGNSWLAMTWWTKIPYNELLTLEPKKTKNLSVIDSGKRLTEYHNFRVDLIDSLINKHKDVFDCYGSICGNSLPNRDKTRGLIDYKYNLSIENGRTDYYFSEKFCDPILFLTMPIYSGCKQIDKFFPKGSYILFDETKGIDYNVDKIIEICNSNYRDENIENLKEAKHLVLNKYNIWNTISLAINEGKLL